MSRYVITHAFIDTQLKHAAASISRRTVALRKVLQEESAPISARVKVTRNNKTVIINDVTRNKRIRRLNRRAHLSK